MLATHRTVILWRGPSEFMIITILSYCLILERRALLYKPYLFCEQKSQNAGWYWATQLMMCPEYLLVTHRTVGWRPWHHQNDCNRLQSSWDLVAFQMVASKTSQSVSSHSQSVAIFKSDFGASRHQLNGSKIESVCYQLQVYGVMLAFTWNLFVIIWPLTENCQSMMPCYLHTNLH